MRWEIFALVLFLAPALATGHAGHTGHEAAPGTPGQTSGQPAGSAPTPPSNDTARRPGAWPPVDEDNATGPSQESLAAGLSILPAGTYQPMVTSPATREWRGYKADALRSGATAAVAPLAPQKRWDAAGTVGTGILAPPIVAHGLVVFGGLDRKVHAVDVATGFPQWSVEMPDMVFASPLAVDDRVLVASIDGTLRALDLRNGSVAWSLHLGGKSTASPLVVNGVVFTATEEGRVWALQAVDGKPKWNRTIAPFDSLVSPLWVSGRVVVGDLQGRVHGLHALTGQDLWTASIGMPVTATPVSVGNRIIVPSLGLKALEMETGRLLWSSPAGAFMRSSPAHQKGVLVYGDPEAPGIVGANALTGERLWQVPTRLYVRSPPVIAGDVAIAASNDGSVLAMQLRNGTLVWTLDAGANTHAGLVAFDGAVLVPRMDGIVRLLADPAARVAAVDDQVAPPTSESTGLVGLLPIFAAMTLPYLGMKRLRDRMKRAAVAPPAEAPHVPPPPKPRLATGPVRVACPRCACRFGVRPEHHSIVECPACGLRSVVRQRARGGMGADGAGALPG